MIKVAPLPLSTSSECRQRTGLQSCADRSPGHSAASVWTRASTLATTGTSGAWKVDGLEPFAQSGAGRQHHRRVEGPGHRDGQHLAGPELLGMAGGEGDALLRPGDDDLAGGVVVGHPDVRLGPLAGRLGVVVGDPDQRGHGARPGVGRLLHGVAPLDDERRPVGEGQCTGGDQRGVLAEAVARTGAGGEAQALDRVQHHQAHDEGGELGVGRPGELLHRGVEQERRQVTSGDLGGLAGHLPRGVVDPGMAHAGSLGPLSREGKGQHPQAPLTTDRPSTRPVDGPVCHGGGWNRWFVGGPGPVTGGWGADSRPVYARGMATGGDTPEEPPQGWFADPFDVHEARWFSQGTPTALVRDGCTESQDRAARADLDGTSGAGTRPRVGSPRTCRQSGPGHRAGWPIRCPGRSGPDRLGRRVDHGGSGHRPIRRSARWRPRLQVPAGDW